MVKKLASPIKHQASILSLEAMEVFIFFFSPISYQLLNFRLELSVVCCWEGTRAAQLNLGDTFGEILFYAEFIHKVFKQTYSSFQKYQGILNANALRFILALLFHELEPF